MNKDSKQLNQLIGKIKSRLFHQPIERLKYVESLTRLPIDSPLPQAVSVSSINDEPKNFVLCFDRFNFNECSFVSSSPAEFKAVLEIFKNVTTTPSNKIAALKIIKDTIKRDSCGSKYNLLFNGLSPDIDAINEAVISDKGRLFFFTLLQNFYVVAVKAGIHTN